MLRPWMSFEMPRDLYTHSVYRPCPGSGSPGAVKLIASSVWQTYATGLKACFISKASPVVTMTQHMRVILLANATTASPKGAYSWC